MITVSVIIPFFQRKPGILRRALLSIVQQRLSPGIVVEVIVVDDGSPIPTQPETEGLTFSHPFHLTIIPQANAGVAMARNTGLKAVDKLTTYIAFLDSDDSWHAGHLTQGIDSMEQGYDFYFCDHARDGHHLSYFASCSGLLAQKIQDAPLDSLIPLNREEASTVILRDFATQASTTLYRYSMARELLFDTSMKHAGEDTIFFMNLAAKMRHVCFSPRLMVTCGGGINMYFSNLRWDSEGYFRCLVDGLRARLLIKATVKLSRENMRWNNACIARFRRNFVFHILRHAIHSKGDVPSVLKRLACDDKWFYAWFTAYAFQVVIGRLLGLYKPF